MTEQDDARDKGRELFHSSEEVNHLPQGGVQSEEHDRPWVGHPIMSVDPRFVMDQESGP